MKISITRLFGFDYGHRVLGHEGKCASLHGHRGTAEVTCTADRLDSLGRVIDFSKIKELVGGWIDEHWDHTMILHCDDPLLSYSVKNDNVFGPKRPFDMGLGNPTAENLASLLLETANDLLEPYGIRAVQVRFWETPNCFAVATI